MKEFDWTTLRKPRWIAATIVALALAGLFVSLGFWQLDRLAERRARNTTIEVRSSEPPRPLEGLRGDFGDDGTALAYRRATAEGTYLPDQEFFSIGRVYGNLVGTLVATPLKLEDGSILIVLRGVVPPSTEGPPAVGFDVPSLPVVVTGRLDDGEVASRIREPDPVNGQLERLSRIDLAFIDRWVEGDVLPFSLLLDMQRPAGPAMSPVPVPSEELTEGSHLGYAVQWFAFAVTAILGLGALLLKAGRPTGTTGSDVD